MYSWWPNKALWKLDQIRPILVSHLGIFGEQKCEEERRREEEEKKKKKKKKKNNNRKGMELGFCMELFVYGLLDL